MIAPHIDYEAELRRLRMLVDDLRSVLAAIYLTPHSEVSDRESVLAMLRLARQGLDRVERDAKGKP